MAFVEDDFESYSIGTVPPFGPWTGGGGFAQVIAGGPLPASVKCFGLFQGTITHGDLVNFYTDVSIFFAFNPSGNNTLFQCDNGPNLSSHTFTLFQLRVEPDGTITAVIPVSGEIIGNSLDAIVAFDGWNFAQINLTISDWTDAGIKKMHMDCKIALNGRQVISRAFDTQAGVGSWINATSEINKFSFTVGSNHGISFDDYTLDSHKSIVTYPHPGSPKAIIEQGGIELGKLPSTADILVHQGGIELAKLPSSGKIIIYAGGIELLLNKVVSAGLWKVKEI